MTSSNDGYFIIRDMKTQPRTERLKLLRLELEGLLRERPVTGGQEYTVDDLPSLDLISDRGFETRLQQFQEQQKSQGGILRKVLTLGIKPDRLQVLKQFGEYYVPIWKQNADKWHSQLLPLIKSIQSGVHLSNVNLYNFLQESSHLAQIGLRLSQLTRDLHQAAKELGAMYDIFQLERILQYAQEAERVVNALNALRKQAQDKQLRASQPESVVVLSKAKNIGLRNGAVDARFLEEMYDDLEEIGAGGFGKIMSGVRKTDGQRVAIKVIELETISKTVAEQESNLQMYEKEIRFARKIQCQDDSNNGGIPYCALVPMYDYWTSPDRKTLYIEMKLIVGYDGGRILLNSSATVKSSIKDYTFLKNSLISIANSLNHMHEHCVLHRDIKPENLLYERETQHLYLTDYGLSCEYKDQCLRTARGTLRYQDPLWLNRQLPFLNIQSEVYSLGQTFYELLFRKRYIDKTIVTEEMQILSLQDHMNMYQVALDRLKQKSETESGKDFKVMFDIIGRMMHPTEQEKRPTLQSIVLALQNNDIEKLDFTFKDPTCAAKAILGGGKRATRDINKKLHIWIVDQDEQNQ